MGKYSTELNHFVEKLKAGWVINTEVPMTPARNDAVRWVKQQGYIIEDRREGKAIYRRITGKEQPQQLRSKAQITAAKILAKPKLCPFTNVDLSRNNPEIDHKNGRVVTEQNDIQIEINESNVETHFMWISKRANTIKREQCKRCKTSGEKPNATINGLSIPQGQYTGSCNGCYWSDPTTFVRKLLKA